MTSLGDLMDMHSKVPQQDVLPAAKVVAAPLFSRVVAYTPLSPETNIAHYASETGVGWPDAMPPTQTRLVIPPQAEASEGRVIDLTDPQETVVDLNQPRIELPTG